MITGIILTVILITLTIIVISKLLKDFLEAKRSESLTKQDFGLLFFTLILIGLILYLTINILIRGIT